MTSRGEELRALDAFLRELHGADAAAADGGDGAPASEAPGLGLLAVCEGLKPVAPSLDLRARLLHSADAPSRLARFADQVAELLDVGLDKARELLARIDDPSAWEEQLPGVAFLWVEGGPRVAAAVRGFVRVRAGMQFPDHEHLGEEITLVLQGGFEDPDRQVVVRPGEVDHMPVGTSHGFRALAGGTDLLKLAVVHTGLKALGHTYLPR
jgi:quercetin dioxygenase-like cupin family protein